jgi:hypothetical protein
MAGWGDGAWGNGTWGNGETILNGNAASGSVGTITRNVSVALSGVLCHPDVGGVDETNLPEIQEVHANGFAGIASPNRLIALSGVVASGLTGTIANGGVVVGLTGDEAYGYPGGVVVPLSPLTADGFVGNVLSEITIELTGASLSGNVGSVGVGARSLALTGVLAGGSVGNLNAVYWKIIDDSQTASWQNVSNTQTSNWQEIGT